MAVGKHQNVHSDLECNFNRYKIFLCYKRHEVKTNDVLDVRPYGPG